MERVKQCAEVVKQAFEDDLDDLLSAIQYPAVNMSGYIYKIDALTRRKIKLTKAALEAKEPNDARVKIVRLLNDLLVLIQVHGSGKLATLQKLA